MNSQELPVLPPLVYVEKKLSKDEMQSLIKIVVFFFTSTEDDKEEDKNDQMG